MWNIPPFRVSTNSEVDSSTFRKLRRCLGKKTIVYKQQLIRPGGTFLLYRVEPSTFRGVLFRLLG